MTTYVYIPFPKSVLRDAVVTAGYAPEKIIWTNLTVWDDDKQWNDTSRGHFIEKNFLGIAKRPLDKLTSDDILEISAHGMGDYGRAIKSNRIGAEVRTPTGKEGTGALSVKALAERLKKDGLPITFRDIRLMICYSALPGGTKFQYAEGQVDAPADCGAGSFAQLLALELGLLGYRSVVVAGAAGEVVSGKVNIGFENKDGGLRPIAKPFANAWGSRRFNSEGQRLGKV